MTRLLKPNFPYEDKNNKNSMLISNLLFLLEQKEPQLKEHAFNVSTYASIMKEALPSKKRGLFIDLLVAGLLHDIGKLTIPIQILNKPGKLNNNEWELIKKHPELGLYILDGSSFSQEVKEGILFHHENWNGSGYPKGLKGKEIPLIARIISIADSFDAMVMDRPYNKKRTFKEALNDLEKNAGIKYDPNLVALFLRQLEKNLLEKSAI